jgi:GAF domain-containing protein
VGRRAVLCDDRSVPNVDPQKLAASLRRLGESSEDGIGAAIERVVSACVDLFGVDGSGLMVADEQNNLRYVASSDGPGKIMEQVQSETGEGPCVDTFVHGRSVHTADVVVDERWPVSREAIAGHGVRSVLGVPVHLGGVTVGSLDVYRGYPHEWDDSEQEALTSYASVVEAALGAALAAHDATELARQLQYALDNRVLIERAVGFVMARADIDAVPAFDLLRRSARGRRLKVADVAAEVLRTRVVPPA